MLLPGWGVELAIKNMEYKAIDDSKVKTESSEDANYDDLTEDLDEDVKGFVFSKLIERRPDKRDELLTLRDVLLSSSEEDDTLKVSGISL